MEDAEGCFLTLVNPRRSIMDSVSEKLDGAMAKAQTLESGRAGLVSNSTTVCHCTSHFTYLRLSYLIHTMNINCKSLSFASVLLTVSLTRDGCQYDDAIGRG